MGKAQQTILPLDDVVMLVVTGLILEILFYIIKRQKIFKLKQILQIRVLCRSLWLIHPALDGIFVNIEIEFCSSTLDLCPLGW